MWVSSRQSAISYPDHGNDACFAIEDESYWFRHRTACLLAVLERFPSTEVLLDIGGGNGQFAAAVQAAGHPVALLEPGTGAHNARRRGVLNIIHSTFEDASFRPAALGAAGAFDVLEHIADEADFLHRLRAAMRPGARFYCTVPAGRWLWSADDVAAGHHRRHTESSLRRALGRAGFAIDYLSPFFTWLTLPVFFLRALPSRLGWRGAASAARAETVRTDHTLPEALVPVINRTHAWERRCIAAGRRLPAGTSLLCVARVPC